MPARFRVATSRCLDKLQFICKRKEGGISVRKFLYENIVKEGMVDRVIQAQRELEAYYEELDVAGTK